MGIAREGKKGFRKRKGRSLDYAPPFHTTLSGCPTFAPAYVGRKRFSSIASRRLNRNGWGWRPFFFVPRTQVRTWGTRTVLCRMGAVVEAADYASPDGKTIHRSHRLAGLAGKCPLELWQVHHHSLGPKLFR